MEDQVQNIGLVNYLSTIVFGKNRQILQILINDRNEGEDPLFPTINGDFIITIGRNAVILTKLKGKNRVPIITKKWVKLGDNNSNDFIKIHANNEGFNPKVQSFIDMDGIKWRYYKSSDGYEGVKMYDSMGLKYEFVLR